MSSDDIAKPRRRFIAADAFGGPDHAPNAFTAKLGHALARFGRHPRNRLDDFRFTTPQGEIDAVDVATSYPMLNAGLRATGDIIDGEAWTFLNPDDRTDVVHGLTMDVAEATRELRQRLRSGRYRPKPPRLIAIPKVKFRGDIPLTALVDMRPEDVLDPACRGRTRTLTVADQFQRAIGKSAVNLLNTFLHDRLPSTIIGCRPRIGIGTIIKAVGAAVQKTHQNVVLAVDIKGFYDNVPIATALDIARNRIGYRKGSKLGWLIEHAILGRGCYTQRNALPQGCPLSPLLANLYAAEALDVEATKWGPTLRYVDDLFVLCRNVAEARQALVAIRTAAAPMGLRLAEEKTTIVDLRSKPRAMTYLGVDLDVDAAGVLHHRLRNASIVKLWYNLGVAAMKPSGTMDAAQHLQLQIIRRHQIWLGWVYAFGAAEWTAEQTAAVQAIIDTYDLGGGDRLVERFATVWRHSYGGSLADRAEKAEHYMKVFIWSGITARLDADGHLSIDPVNIAAMRTESTRVYTESHVHALRWYASRGGVVVPQWTAPPSPTAPPSLRARVNTADFADSYADALPGLPGDIPVTLGRGARGDGVLPGVIAM